MPLLKFDIIEGRTEQQIGAMLEAAHRAVLKAFAVPQRDRYQIVTEHKAHQVVIQDTGLGIDRTANMVVVTVLTSPRTEAAKQVFFAELARQFEQHCGIASSDLMVSIVTNTPGDWSFGHGVAQYMTGQL
jgi:hypothetical protein